MRDMKQIKYQQIFYTPLMIQISTAGLWRFPSFLNSFFTSNQVEDSGSCSWPAHHTHLQVSSCPFRQLHCVMGAASSGDVIKVFLSSTRVLLRNSVHISGGRERSWACCRIRSWRRKKKKASVTWRLFSQRTDWGHECGSRGSAGTRKRTVVRSNTAVPSDVGRGSLGAAVVQTLLRFICGVKLGARRGRARVHDNMCGNNRIVAVCKRKNKIIISS